MYKFEVGDNVEVFEDVLTQKIHEGVAKIVRIHKQNKKVVDCDVKFYIDGIRKSKGSKNSKVNKSGEGSKSPINTCEFHQLQSMIEYKSKICGIPVAFVDPRYISQRCNNKLEDDAVRRQIKVPSGKRSTQTLKEIMA